MLMEQVGLVQSMAHRLTRLAHLYEQGQASPWMARTIDKILAYEADLVRTQIAQLQTDLDRFEEQYALPSAEFYQQYQTGQTDDRMDFVEWASLVQMMQNLHARLTLLTDEDGM